MTGACPRLSRGVRLSFDEVRGVHVLLYPEGVLFPSRSAVGVLRRCDGVRTVTAIVEDLRRHYRSVEPADVTDLVERLAERGLLELSDG